MIAFFPELYEDELAYSWFSRYYTKSGYLSLRYALDDLYVKRYVNPETGGEGTCDKTLRYGKSHSGAYHVFLLWEISAGCEEAGGLPGTAGHEWEFQ